MLCFVRLAQKTVQTVPGKPIAPKYCQSYLRRTGNTDSKHRCGAYGRTIFEAMAQWQRAQRTAGRLRQPATLIAMLRGSLPSAVTSLLRWRLEAPQMRKRAKANAGGSAVERQVTASNNVHTHNQRVVWPGKIRLTYSILLAYRQVMVGPSWQTLAGPKTARVRSMQAYL